MVSAIKHYAPIDLVDLNKISNMGNPTDAQDAATKVYVDVSTYQDPLQMEGDLVYETGSGPLVVSSQPAEHGWHEEVGTRVTGLTPGHTIRVSWENSSGANTWVRTYHEGGSAAIQSISIASLGSGHFHAYSRDVVLGAGETEIQPHSDAAWGNPVNNIWKSILYTDLNATVPARLPVGDTGEVLRVTAGVPAWEALTGKIEFGFGGTSAPSLGIRTDFEVPYGLTITGWTVIADAVGDLQVDLWKDTYANFPPTVADTVTGSDKPRLSGEQKATSTALTGWTTSWAAGDVIRVNLDSLTTIKRATVILNFTRVT